MRKTMNKRLTKRWACHHCSEVLRTAFEAGWPFNYDRGGETWSPFCEKRIGEAIEDIIAELHRRGLKEGDPDVSAGPW